jgi:hypothetical protein
VLTEIKNDDPGDAITDAGTALQEALIALGCTGNTLSELRKSGQQLGILKAADQRLTGVIGQTIERVSGERNAGEAHRGDPDINLSDAWMVVHVVGALIIRLSES